MNIKLRSILLIIPLALLVILFFSQKKQTNNSVAASDINPQFDIYKANFIEQLWAVYPLWASNQGYHKYDSILIVPNNASRANELAFSNANLDSLKTFDVTLLSDNNKTDYYMIENQLKTIIFSITELKSYEWNPSDYNVSGAFAEILIGNYDSLDVRLRNFNLKMANITAYYEAAKKNINNPTIEHSLLAIDQNLGGISVFEKDFIDSLNKVPFGEHERQMMEANARESVKAIKGYVLWLKTMSNKTPRSFRLGKDLYEKKFEFDIQSGYTVDQIYNKALQHKKGLHEKMYTIADNLWEKYFVNGEDVSAKLKSITKPKDTLQLIKQVIDKISEKHVKPDEFQSAIEQQLPVLTDFILKKDLIYIDPTKPLVVRKEPDYMAGVAGASISAPGPYDKNGNTYYNVGSLSGWDKDKAESYLREYNYYILQILNIHEAIPGHYTQLVYSNQSPSLIKSLFGNSSMIEGWAVYTERMMLESGYDNSPEMWLMYFKWNLRSTCNTILDYSVHTKNMNKKDALYLLIDEAFQQKSEAEGKWKRVTVTQVQLCCYFTGFTEIYDFREELKKLQGNNFNLKQFHEKFLSYGSAPVKYIKELMKSDLKIKPN